MGVHQIGKSGRRAVGDPRATCNFRPYYDAGASRLPPSALARDGPRGAMHGSVERLRP